VSPSVPRLSLAGEGVSPLDTQGAGIGETPTSMVFPPTPSQAETQDLSRNRETPPLLREESSASPDFLNVRSSSPFKVEFDSQSSRNQNVTTSSDDSGMETGAAYYTAPSAKSIKPSRRSSSDGVNPVQASRTPEFVQGTSRVPFRLTNLTIPASTIPLSHTKRTSGSDEATSDGVTSFLDFSSSREGSVRSRSLKTMGSDDRVFGEGDSPLVPFPSLSVPGSTDPRSRWSNTTAPSVATQPLAAADANELPRTHNSLGSQEDSPSSQRVAAPRSAEGETVSIAGSNTFPISFLVNIPPSPHHIMDFQTQSPVEEPEEGSTSREGRRQSSLSNITQDNPVHVHPIHGALESPTESLPKSVSEAQFQNSDSEGNPSDSRRTTGSSIPFPSHPALPRQISSPSPMATVRPGVPISLDRAQLAASFNTDSSNDVSNSENTRTTG